MQSPPVIEQRVAYAGDALAVPSAAPIVPPHDVQTRVTVDVVWSLT